MGSDSYLGTTPEITRKETLIPEVATFAEIAEEFLARITRAVYCNMATVDRQGRSRSRMLHPIWEGPIGWSISWPASHKAKHLAHNPCVSLAYIQEKEKPVYVDCRAEWIDDEAEQWRIWARHQQTPPPLGFDPQPHYGDIHHPYFCLLKFTPWRVELGNLVGEPVVWRASSRVKTRCYTAVEMGTGVFTSGQNSGSHSERSITAKSRHSG